MPASQTAQPRAHQGLEHGVDPVSSPRLGVEPDLLVRAVGSGFGAATTWGQDRIDFVERILAA